MPPIGSQAGSVALLFMRRPYSDLSRPTARYGAGCTVLVESRLA
jgi:hypothetical protein